MLSLVIGDPEITSGGIWNKKNAGRFFPSVFGIFSQEKNVNFGIWTPTNHFLGHLGPQTSFELFLQFYFS